MLNQFPSIGVTVTIQEYVYCTQISMHNNLDHLYIQYIFFLSVNIVYIYLMLDSL